MLIWHRVGLGLNLFDSFSSDHGVLYGGTWSNRVLAVDAKTGDLRWTRREDGIVTSVPAVDNGMVIFGSNDGQVTARNAHTGRLRWRFTTHAQIRGSVAIANGVAYVQSADESTYALDAESGTNLWSAVTGLNQGSGSPVVSNGRLYAAGSGELTAYRLPA
jgi:eukaryotic-like serine/threonine-protein kinase